MDVGCNWMFPSPGASCSNTDNAYILDKSLFTKSHNNIVFPKIYLLDSNLSSG